MFEVQQTDTFRKWLNGLKNQTDMIRILDRIVRLESGNFGDSKSLGDGLSELRLHFGQGYRIYYTKRGQSIVLLLNGGPKKSQQRDIERARSIAKDLDQ